MFQVRLEMRLISKKFTFNSLYKAKDSSKQSKLPPMQSSSEGAISVVVALVLPIVIIATFAIVIDVGQILRERRELLKVSESISLYIAEQCAKNDLCPTSIVGATNSNPGPIGDFLTLNAKDGLTSFKICGFDSREASLDLPRLKPCEDSSDSIYDCRNESVKDNSGYKFSFVRVTTSTKSDGENSDSLNLFFADLLPGGLDRASAFACSQAAWNPVVQAPIVYPLALPICESGYSLDGYPEIRFFEGYDSDKKVFNDPIKETGPCNYKPFGSTQTTSIIDRPFIKGAAIYDTVDGDSIGCPFPLDPIVLSVGQALEITPTSNDVISKCDSLLRELGYSNKPNAKDYGKFLDDYFLKREIYLPLVGECVKPPDYKTVEFDSSKCGAFRIVGFATLKIYGIRLQVTGAETGSGPIGFNRITKEPAANWSECSGNFCIFGEYKRTAPPKKPIPLPPGTLPPVNAGSQSVFLIP